MAEEEDIDPADLARFGLTAKLILLEELLLQSFTLLFGESDDPKRAAQTFGKELVAQLDRSGEIMDPWEVNPRPFPPALVRMAKDEARQFAERLEIRLDEISNAPTD